MQKVGSNDKYFVGYVYLFALNRFFPRSRASKFLFFKKINWHLTSGSGFNLWFQVEKFYPIMNYTTVCQFFFQKKISDNYNSSPDPIFHSTQKMTNRFRSKFCQNNTFQQEALNKTNFLMRENNLKICSGWVIDRDIKLKSFDKLTKKNNKKNKLAKKIVSKYTR